MALTNNDQAQIREYLLGKLSEDEQQRIEERLMVEDEFFDEFEVSKDELIEEYNAGDLSHAEREWFEGNFLATPEGRERQLFALAMSCLQRQRVVPIFNDVPDGAPEEDPPPVWPEGGRQLAFLGPLQGFAATQPWVFAAASLVLVLLLAFAVTRFASRSPGQIFEATLKNDTLVRGEGSLPPVKLKLPPNTGQLKVHLQLPKTAATDTRYEAELDDRLNKKKVQIAGSDAQSVTVVVPAALLPRGEYSLLLSLTNPNGNQQRLTYRFNVE